jgi:alpha-tubulin suppressor-like RCC1 family protein
MVSRSASGAYWQARDLYGDHAHIAATHSTVAGGTHHMCAITNSGGVKCWGNNLYGSLGDGTIVERHTPVDVVGLSANVISVGGGWGHSCALLRWGEVRCWGSNGYGQIGDGTSRTRYTPVTVSGLDYGVVQLSVGLWHSCAVLSSGGVRCWGAGENGRLGDGAEEVRRIPVDVVGLSSGVAAVGAGGAHTCALLHSGGVKCWGVNNFGTLGDGTTVYERLTPVNVVGLSSGAVALSTGGSHNCVLMDAGRLRCWGLNRYGELGDGTIIQRNVPVWVVDNGKTFTHVVASSGHTCALTDARLVKCWGRNDAGQLGDDTLVNRPLPGYVIGLASDVVDIGVGYYRSCARIDGGAIKCWGNNTLGALGDGTTVNRRLPVYVSGFRTTLDINYTSGRQGSYFGLTGALFPANATATITINGQVLCTTQTDADGNLAFQLRTAEADDGLYLVRATVNPSATTTFAVAPEAPLRQPTGSGVLVNVPAGMGLTPEAFMPIVER